MKNPLLKISFTITILGILILLIISNIIQPKLTTINQLTIKQLNKQVKIQGKITNIKTINPTFHILTIKDSTSTIQATTNNQKNLIKNQTIILTGTLQPYKNQLQIQTNNIITQPQHL